MEKLHRTREPDATAKLCAPQTSRCILLREQEAVMAAGDGGSRNEGRRVGKASPVKWNDIAQSCIVFLWAENVSV